MRCVRMAVAGSIVLAVLGTSATAALAAPAPLPTPVPAAVAPSTICTIPTGSQGAAELTGLVATSDGYVAIDGRNQSLSLRIFYLDKSCNRTDTQQYSGTGAVDPQDLAIDSKGVLWVADIGDDANASSPVRTLVSLYKVPSKSSMTHYKFSYPDGAHNAGAFLLNGNGDPIFITKSISGAAGIYTYSGTLSTSQTMPLAKAGSFQPEQTGTANKLGTNGFAQNEITGGANAPGGKKVALRTFTDAYEWDVSNGDVLGALKKKPRITPMPNEDQGYAIAYTADGASFLTVSDGAGPTPILKYKPSGTPAATSTAHKPAGPATPGTLRKFFNDLTFRQLMILLGGVAVFGLLLLLIGILGIRRSREAYRAAEARAARADKSAAGKASAPVGAGVGGSGVYGAPRPPGSGQPGGGTVYGAPPDPYAPPPPPSPGPPSPSGGGRSGGGVYGGGQYGAPVDPYADGGHGGHGGHGGQDHRPSPYGRPDY